jgi:uncharacterized membrane protein YfcA
MLFILGAIIGLSSSFISTLLGGGSGLIAIPAFFYIVVHTYGAESAMQIALATTYAMSVFLSLIAVLKHHKNKNLNLFEIRYYIIYLIIGYILGSFIVKHIDTVILKHVFSVILLLSGLWMIFHNDKKPVKKIPSFIVYPITSICGVMSTLAASSTFVTVLFVKIGMDIKKAVANTSFCVLINASTGAILLTVGVNIDVPSTFGYISVPLLLSSIPFAIIGSLLAVKYLDVISTRFLHFLFIVLMFASAAIMLL